MPWLKTHPSRRDVLARLSFEAEAVWHITRLYCAGVGNDGQLPKREVVVAVARKISQRAVERLADELVTEGLWVDLGDRYEIVGFLKDNPPADVWEDDTQRERWARNKALLRDRPTCKAVQHRDENRCRYCGERVNWADKRGPHGGTYDHVDPDGGNELVNVVVACRRCNGRKKDRTPEQAGMPLLAPGSRALRSVSDLADIQPGLDPAKSTIQPDPTSRSETHRAHTRGETDSNRAKSGPDSGQVEPGRERGSA